MANAPSRRPGWRAVASKCRQSGRLALLTVAAWHMDSARNRYPARTGNRRSHQTGRSARQSGWSIADQQVPRPSAEAITVIIACMAVVPLSAIMCTPRLWPHVFRR